LTRLTWPRIREVSPLGFLLLTSFLLRLALIPLFYDDFNSWAFGTFGNFLIHGYDPYLVVTQDPTLLGINPWRYPPLYLLLTVPALLAKLATNQTLVYLTALKIPAAVCDVVATLYLYKILEMRFARTVALKGSAFFAFNPAVIFVSAVAGFNDSLAVMFTVISLYHYLSYKKSNDSSSRPGLYKSGLFLGLGIVSKIYPMLLTPIFVKDSKTWGDRLLLLFSSTLPVLIFSLPFLAWDPYSYFYLLTIKNAGGQHALFRALILPPFEEFALLGFLLLALGGIYISRLTLSSRLVLIFLWIGLATQSNTFNYMIWGIPFYTLFLSENESGPKTLPLYPLIPLFGALVFNGIYNGVGGASGLYYWMFHLLQQQVVVFGAYPWLGQLAQLTPIITTLFAVYYSARIAWSPLNQRIHHVMRRLPLRITIPALSKGTRPWLTLLLLILAIFSWGYVVTHARFEDRSYPIIQEGIFNFTSSFPSPLLDYQLVFAGAGSYSISADTGYIALSSASRSDNSSYLYRGYPGVLDGFHPSNEASIWFKFKVDDFPSNRPNMTIARVNGGDLTIARNNTRMSFEFFDSVLNISRVLSSGDLQWHSFAIYYALQNRTIILDNNRLVLSPETFTRVMLGNTLSQGAFGEVEYSDLLVSIRDFPGGPSSPVYGLVALGAPLLLTVLAFGIVRRDPLKVFTKTKSPHITMCLFHYPFIHKCRRRESTVRS
jgi:hypothetical protein